MSGDILLCVVLALQVGVTACVVVAYDRSVNAGGGK